MAEVGVALRYRVETLEWGNKLTSGIHFDLQLAARHCSYARGKAFCAGAQAGEIFRPCGHHLELLDALRKCWSRYGCGGRGNSAGGCTLQKLAALHKQNSSLC